MPRELPGMAELIGAEKAVQGRMGRGELSVAVVFLLTAGCWVFRPAHRQRRAARLGYDRRDGRRTPVIHDPRGF